jgi:hypothetical protein
MTGDQALQRRRRDWHFSVLVGAVAVMVLAAILQVRTDQRVALTGLQGAPIPETCGMRIMFQRDCPGCGLTRSFIHLAHGDWRRSLAIHRVGWLLALVVVAQIPYRLLVMRYPAYTVSGRWSAILGITLGVALVINWIYKICFESW